MSHEDNAVRLSGAIDDPRDLHEAGSYKEFWDQQKVVAELFRTLRPLAHDDRERFWSEYNGILDEASAARERWNKAADNNAESLTKSIEELASTYLPSFFDDSSRLDSQFWSDAREVRDELKNTLELRRPDRDRLWKRLNEIYDRASAIRDRQSRDSPIKRDIIMRTLDEVKLSEWATDKEQIRGGFDQLYEVRELISTDGWSGQTAYLVNGSGRLLRDDRQDCWDYWHRVKEALENRRAHLQDSDYSEAKGESQGALRMARYDDPYEARDEIQRCQRGLKDYYMRPEQFDDVREILNEAWELAMDRIAERREERERKHAEWRERQESHISRWQGMIEDSEAFIDRLESQINDLRDQIGNAWSDDFVERAEGWIEEKEEKIRSVREQIEGLEEKIRDVQRQLDNG